MSFRNLENMCNAQNSESRMTYSLQSPGYQRVRMGVWWKESSHRFSVFLCRHSMHSLHSQVTPQFPWSWQGLARSSPASDAKVYHAPGVADVDPSWFSWWHSSWRSQLGLWLAWTQRLLSRYHHLQFCCVVTIMWPCCHFSFLSSSCWWSWASIPSVTNTVLCISQHGGLTLLVFVCLVFVLFFFNVAVVFIALPYLQVNPCQILWSGPYDTWGEGRGIPPYLSKHIFPAKDESAI